MEDEKRMTFTAGALMILALYNPTPKWQLTYCKGGTFHYMYEKAPNLFHRLMQRIILGVIWERIKGK